VRESNDILLDAQECHIKINRNVLQSNLQHQEGEVHQKPYEKGIAKR